MMPMLCSEVFVGFEPAKSLCTTDATGSEKFSIKQGDFGPVLHEYQCCSRSRLDVENIPSRSL